LAWLVNAADRVGFFAPTGRIGPLGSASCGDYIDLAKALLMVMLCDGAGIPLVRELEVAFAADCSLESQTSPNDIALEFQLSDAAR
jgi:hypothetical protein